MNLENIIKQSTILDVRTHQEFMGGNVFGSINIPLGEIENRMEEIQNLKTPIILCCASGNRSCQAEQYLLQKGIDC